MIASLLSEYWPVIAAAFGALFIYLKGRGDGSKGEINKRAREQAKAIVQKRKDEDEISELDDTSLADRISRVRGE
jgi:hypothetical protein